MNADIDAVVCIKGKMAIGGNVMIGAGSMVTKNILSDCVVVEKQ